MGQREVRCRRDACSGGLDLIADENQVYLFMVLFGSILFNASADQAVEVLPTARGVVADLSAGLELWDFQDEFDDMRGVKDPLEEENKRGRKGQKKKKKKKGGKEPGAK